MDLEAKVAKIQKWLGTLSGDLQKDSYEINEFTVDYLYHLAQLNEKKDAHLEVMIKDNADKSEEFSTESERIKEENGSLGISEKNMCKDVLDNIEQLSEIGNSLGITNPSLENLLLRLSDHTLEETDLKDSLKEQEVLLQSIKQKLDSLETTLEKLRGEVDTDSSEKDVGEDLQVKIEEAKAQAQHYFESTKKYKKQLGASGIKKEYTHEYLTTLARKVENLSTEIAATRDRLTVFKELPPSIPLATERIRQVQKKLEAVEQQFPELTCLS